MRIIDAAESVLQKIQVSCVGHIHLDDANHVRDDLTVEVIFFGNGEKNDRSVTVNKDASATLEDVKAKL